MKEKILNVFLFVNDQDVIDSFGVTVHEREGTDASKILYLQSTVSADAAKAKHFPLPEWCMVVDPSGKKTTRRLSWNGWVAILGTPDQLRLLEAGFVWAGVGREPLMVATAVVDGRPRADAFVRDAFYKGA